MMSITVQGIEEWLFSDFYLQMIKQLNLRDNLLYTSNFHTKVKWQHTVNISNFYHEKSNIRTSLISNKPDFKKMYRDKCSLYFKLNVLWM